MVSYSELRDIQRKEMESSAVVPLAEDFYRAVSALLAKKGGEAMESKSLLVIKEHENIKKVVISIAGKREEKIVLMAVRGEREGNGLTAEERELLKELSSIIKKSRESVRNVWGSEENAPNPDKIRILKDVSQYRGLDNALYGPFRSGEEKLLPRAEVEWLLKAGMAEQVT